VIGAVSFLTIFGRGRRPTPMSYAWFPVVGFVIGLAAAAVFALVQRNTTNTFLPAVAAVIALTVLTGGLHLDGLADSADALCASVPAERRLEIMRDPHIGTFGVVALVLDILVKTLAIGSLDHRGAAAYLAFGLSAMLGRWVMVVGALGRYARPGGLGALFAEGGRAPIYIASAVTACIVAVCASRYMRLTVWLVVAAIVTGGAVHLFAYRRIDGYTGDTLGAAGELTETGCLSLVNALTLA
jgi:adenosylcobinamide-GDP ribazoletransferase